MCAYYRADDPPPLSAPEVATLLRRLTVDVRLVRVDSAALGTPGLIGPVDGSLPDAADCALLLLPGNP
jgi:hypothetical protein